MILIQHMQNIGRAKHEMIRKFIGLNGVNYVIQMIEEEWALETFMLSTLPC